MCDRIKDACFFILNLVVWGLIQSEEIQAANCQKVTRSTKSQEAGESKTEFLCKLSTIGRTIWLPRLTGTGPAFSTVGGRRKLAKELVLCEALLALGPSYLDSLTEWPSAKRDRCKQIIGELQRLSEDELLRGDEDKVNAAQLAKWGVYETNLKQLLSLDEIRETIAAIEYGVVVSEGLPAWLESESGKAWLGIQGDDRKRLQTKLEQVRDDATREIEIAVFKVNARIMNALPDAEQLKMKYWTDDGIGGVLALDFYRCQLNAFCSLTKRVAEEPGKAGSLCRLLRDLDYFTTEPNGEIQLLESEAFQVPSGIMNILRDVPEAELSREKKLALFTQVDALQDEWIQQYKTANNVAAFVGSLDPVKQPSVFEAERIAAQKYLARLDEIVTESLPPSVIESLEFRLKRQLCLTKGLPAALAMGILAPDMVCKPTELERLRNICKEEKSRLEKESDRLQEKFLRQLSDSLPEMAKESWDQIFSHPNRARAPGLLLRTSSK